MADKLKHRRFLPNVKKHFFTARVTEHWNRLPREAVESPPMEMLKTCLVMVLSKLLWVTLVLQPRGAGQEVPSNLSHSVIQAQIRALDHESQSYFTSSQSEGSQPKTRKRRIWSFFSLRVGGMGVGDFCCVLLLN